MRWERPNFNVPTTLLWDLINKCNLRCKHCYNGYKYFSTSESKHKLVSYQKVVSHISADDVGLVHFLGGEPFLHPNIFDIANQLNNKGIRVGVNTNGMLLEKYSSKIKQANFDQIVVSLESPSEEVHDQIRGRGVFKKVKKGLSFLKEVGTKLVVSWTLTKESIKRRGEAEEMLYLCEFAGAHTLIINWLFMDGFATDNIKQLTYRTGDALEFVCYIVKLWKENKSVRLQLDARPKFVDYLNRKYGVDMPITANTGICKGARTHYMLRSNGDLFPCAPFDSEYGEKFRQKNNFCFFPPNLENISLKDAIYSTSFIEWKKNTSPALIKAKSRECEYCEFGNICEPCPIIDASEVAEECKYLLTKNLKGEEA